MVSASSPGSRQPLQLGDLSPDKWPVQIVRDGETVTLWAYVEGPRCPGAVKARVAKAAALYRANLAEFNLTQDVDDHEAWHDYLAETLRSVIEGIAYEESEVLAGNVGHASDTLRALGFMKPRAVDAPPEASAAQPGSPSTTPLSLPTSRTSASRRRKR
jgi:hypothetical protein